MQYHILTGWAGVECTTNLDDCIGNRCSEGSTCIDDVGYYTCKCPPGRVGLYMYEQTLIAVIAVIMFS